VNDIERIGEFVGDLEPPVLAAGAQPAVEVLDDLSCGHRCLSPRGVHVGEFFAFLVQFRPVVIEVETSHAGQPKNPPQKSNDGAEKRRDLEAADHRRRKLRIRTSKA
jgi:hypothetical protein